MPSRGRAGVVTLKRLCLSPTAAGMPHEDADPTARPKGGLAVCMSSIRQRLTAAGLCCRMHSGRSLSAGDNELFDVSVRQQGAQNPGGGVDNSVSCTLCR